MRYYDYWNSPIGLLKITAENNCITSVSPASEAEYSRDMGSHRCNNSKAVKEHTGKNDNYSCSKAECLGYLGEKEACYKPAEKTLLQAKAELKEYFAGTLKEFTVKLSPTGTEFQKKVWEELLKIPYGTTICYEELAIRTGNPKASRAVGSANGKNPIPFIIPCHRVIAKNGGLGGYGLGLDLKKYLLNLEGSLK